jgi:hypothetical protein
MTQLVRAMPHLSTLLQLGRVSNLPTVWTNVIAGTVLSGAAVFEARTAAVALVMSAFYVGGMYLNDAFDRAVDARERPSRPIPAGKIPVSTVYLIGFGLLALATATMSLFGPLAGALGAALALAIVAYNLWHKGNPAAPAMMGFCRALVYAGAAAVATASVGTTIIVWALALGAHIVGLTYAAREENFDRVDRLWPLAILVLPLLLALPHLARGGLVALTFVALLLANAVAVRLLATRRIPGAVPKAVAGLIAGVCLVDALAVAIAGGGGALVGLCLAGFVLTRIFQKAVPGT